MLGGRENLLRVLSSQRLIDFCAQFFALASPLVFFAVVFRSAGADAVLACEASLAIAGFGALLIDFNGSVYLAKKQASIMKSGAISTIFTLRATMLAIYVLALILADFVSFIVLPKDEGTLFALALMLVGTLVDFGWIAIGRGYNWILSINIASRFLGAIALFEYLHMPAAISLGCTVLITSALTTLVIFLVWTPKPNFGSVRASFMRTYHRRMRLAVLTDLLTGAITRLDVLVAVMYLPVEQAALYAVIRRLYMALTAIIYASSRILYTSRSVEQLRDLKTLLAILSRYSPYLFMITAPVVAFFVFDQTDVTSLIILSAIVSLNFRFAYQKNTLQYGVLFKADKYRENFYRTAASFLVFLIPVACLASGFVGSSAASLAAIRVLSEAAYSRLPRRFLVGC